MLALALLAGFITILTRVKSFHVPGSEYLMKDADVGILGGPRHLFRCGRVVWPALGLYISPAFGPFFHGGLAIGHSDGLRRGALAMARPVQAILLFVFFLPVGLLIDLNYLLAHIFIIAAALVVVTGGKNLFELVTANV